MCGRCSQRRQHSPLQESPGYFQEGDVVRTACLGWWLSLGIGLSLGLPALAQVPPGPASKTPASLLRIPPEVSIRAWVNGKPIFDQDLLNDAALELLQADHLPEPQRSAQRREILKRHLQQLIDRELILQDARRKLKNNRPVQEKLQELAEKEFEKMLPRLKRHLGGEERFQEWLRLQGLTLETFRKKHEEQFLINQYLLSRTGPLEEAIGQPEIREYYDQHLNEFQTVDRVQWQDLFIAVGPKHPTLADAHRFAEYLISLLRQGEDFANLLPYDDGPCRANHGFGIGERRGEIRPPEVEAYIWSMRDGEVGPPLDLPTGVHVFRLVKRYYAGQLPFDEKVQSQIRDKLRLEVRERERQRILRELAAQAVIHVESRPLP